MNENEKLNFLLRYMKLSDKVVADGLGVHSSNISRWRKDLELKKMHILAISKLFNVPLEIFNDKKIDTEEKIKLMLDRYKQKQKTIFYQNRDILNKLTEKNDGIWYFYSYPSTISLGHIWITKTQFFSDFTVVDEHNNSGELMIGQNQSIILKESNNSKNITAIIFDNIKITYNILPFSRISKSNAINEEMFNFGFFSQTKFPENEAMEILGNKPELQLKIDYEFIKRVNSYIEYNY